MAIIHHLFDLQTSNEAKSLLLGVEIASDAMEVHAASTTSQEAPAAQ
jgi:hypothetical protein